MKIFYTLVKHFLLLSLIIAPTANSSILNKIDLSGLRIGIFHGTFDPPHLGHLKVALAALKEGKLDYVLFIPNDNAFYKPGVSDLRKRWEWSQMITENEPRIIVPDFGELANGQFIEPNGTYLDELLSTLSSKKAHPVGIIGSDNARSDYKEGFFYLKADIFIKEWLINRRGNDKGDIPNQLVDKTTNETHPAKDFDAEDGGVSSTEIRNKLKNENFDVPLPKNLLLKIISDGDFGTNPNIHLNCLKIF